MKAATSTAAAPVVSGASYDDDEARWEAVCERDAAADGRLWFSVSTTGVYCYPSCPARRPLRSNVQFHLSRDAAERAGFRPCRRCRPDLPPPRVREAQRVAEACRIIASAERAPDLKTLAGTLGLSPYHFQRSFKKLTGVTPRQYAASQRAERVRQELVDGASVTDAIYGAGYGSSSRFYAEADAVLGMSPSAYSQGGKGMTIRWDVARSWLGFVVVAATERGICAILFDEALENDRARAERALPAALAQRFRNARLERAESGSEFSSWIARTVGFIDEPSGDFDWPLDIIGTAFQARVWEALRKIPAGRTSTYADVAARIGKPQGARAVARACGDNPLAVVIPCHRVVGRDGSLRGYRWGLERKRALLERERVRR